MTRRTSPAAPKSPSASGEDATPSVPCVIFATGGIALRTAEQADRLTADGAGRRATPQDLKIAGWSR